MDRRTLDSSVTPTQAVNRIGRIGEIARRYERNIAGSKQFRNDVYGDSVDKARSRGYSQNTYMGVNAG